MASTRVLTPFQLALRALQAGSAVAALCATLYGYRDGPRNALDVSVCPSGRLASLAVLLIALALYSAALWALHYVLVLGVWNLAARRPSGGCQRVLDGFHAVCALVAGVLLVTVDAFRNCQDSSRMHCGALRAGAALSFVAAALFSVSLVSGCLEKAAVAAAIVDITAAPSGQETHNSAYATLQSPSIRETTRARSEHEVSNELCASDLAELRRGVRFLQFGGSVIALVNVLLGFKRFFLDPDVATAAVFAVLATYTSAVFSGWHLLVVDLCEFALPLTLSVERTVEVAFTVLLLAAGFMFEAMDPIDDCGDTCGGSHTAAVTFAFIVAAAFAVDLAFAFSKYRDAKVLSPLSTPTDQYHLQQEHPAIPRRGQRYSTRARTLSAVIV